MYAKKLDNLDEMDKFLEYELFILTQECCQGIKGGKQGVTNQWA
jgi:hypothetical protein